MAASRVRLGLALFAAFGAVGVLLGGWLLLAGSRRGLAGWLVLSLGAVIVLLALQRLLQAGNAARRAATMTRRPVGLVAGTAPGTNVLPELLALDEHLAPRAIAMLPAAGLPAPRVAEPERNEVQLDWRPESAHRRLPSVRRRTGWQRLLHWLQRS